MRYSTNIRMIKSFFHKKLEALFLKGNARGLQPKHIARLRLILALLNAAVQVKDVDFPGAKLHPLKGKEQGRWTIKVDENWRITFRIIDGDIYDIDYKDYH